MNGRNDGGPAFPVMDHSEGIGLACREFGMSLRDYLAARAVPGILASDIYLRALSKQAGEKSMAPFVAACAYELADALLAERAK